MNTFEWCKYCYEKGWAKIEQLKIWIQVGKLKEEELDKIISQ